MATQDGWGDPKFWDDAQEVETDFFRFEKKGDVLIGKLIEKSQAEIRGSLVGRYIFVDPDGQNVSCHGATQLDDKMSSVMVGSIVRIEYTGDTKTQSGNMKMFSVRERATADSR